MVNAQEWLDQNYPNEELSEIYINEQLVGKLDLKGYNKLWKVSISQYVDKSKFEIKNAFYEHYGLNKETQIIQLANPQTYLQKKYPAEKKREQVKELNLYDKNLEGELDLSDFRNLEWLDCFGNKLTSLNLSSCNKLKVIRCPSNQLTNLNCSNLNQLKELFCYDNYLIQIIYPTNPERLTNLDVGDNNLPTQNLTVFSQFRNLELLWIGNRDKDKLSQGIYNRFVGSLEYLQNLSKLKYLDVANTDLTSGVEYLPESLNGIYYETKARSTSKLTEIKEQLGLFAKRKGWAELDFTFEQGLEWMSIGLGFNDYDFAGYLKWRDISSQATKNNLKELRKEYNQFKEWEKWKNLGFVYEQTLELIKTGLKVNEYYLVKQWQNYNFTVEQIKQWIIVGVRADDCGFVAWLWNTKKLSPEWVLNYQEDYWVLRDRFKKYGFCSECNQLNTGEKWCQSCNSERLKKNFANWTSSNPKIDKFIQKHQLEATETNKLLEWIPYEQFTNIEYLAEGGFGKVYKTKWGKGNICHWDIKNKQWSREKDYYYEEDDEKRRNYKTVVLKSLTNSRENANFLQETANHKIIDDWFNNIVPCYGISQDPQTGNYLMVMEYIPEGNLRHYLSNKNRELSLQDKFSQLVNIARGLKDIHQKNLVHRDFHSGNILKGIEKTSCLITDLGLCKSEDEVSQEKKVFGVLPYVAPEVLRQQPYTQKADIYSFGIIAYEVLSGLPPYYDQEHGAILGAQICQGLRPQFQIKIPQLLGDLIKRCWDADPKNRPTANELEKVLRNWEKEISSGDTELKKQLQAAEELNKNLSEEIKFPDYKTKIHTGAVYHSKLLPTKEITRLLQTTEYPQSLAIDFTNLEIKDNQTEQEEIIAQQEIPPK